MQYLKANTEVKVVVGPFVDKDDGLVPEVGVDISTADEAEIMKHDAASVTDISGATWAAIGSCDGYYNLTLTTALTDTEGMLTVVVQDDSVCLPVRATFMVLAEAAYDSMFTAKDTGFMDVNVKAVSEDTAAADNLESACDNYSATRGLTGTALPAAVADAAGGLMISDDGGWDADELYDAIITDATGANIAIDVIALKAETVDILADTAVIGALGAGLTAITDQTDLITAARMGALTDWINGGRLDLILDAVLAMLDDARGEPDAGAPPVNPDAMTKLDYLYKFLRNKIETTPTKIHVYDNVGTTKDHTSDISTSGTTFTRGEFGAGD